MAKRLRGELDARYRELPDFQRNRIELCLYIQMLRAHGRARSGQREN